MRSKKTKEEHMKTIQTNKGLCVGPSCPIYNERVNEKGELFYCALGEIPTCITKESGCICPTCTITEKMRLTNEYFCTKRTEKQQRGNR